MVLPSSRSIPSVLPAKSFEVLAPPLLKYPGVVVHLHSLHHLNHFPYRLKVCNWDPPFVPRGLSIWLTHSMQVEKYLFFSNPHLFTAWDLFPICCPLGDTKPLRNYLLDTSKTFRLSFLLFPHKELQLDSTMPLLIHACTDLWFGISDVHLQVKSTFWLCTSLPTNTHSAHPLTNHPILLHVNLQLWKWWLELFVVHKPNKCWSLSYKYKNYISQWIILNM